MKRIFLSIYAILISVVILFALIQFNINKPIHILRRLNLQNKLLLEPRIMILRVNYLGFLPVGEAKLENKGEQILEGRKIYHLSAQASVLEFFSKFFNAKAQVNSYIDKEKMHTLKFTQTLIIPDKPKEEKEILYNQNDNVMELEGVRRQILPDTQDPLSAIFYIQHQNFELGKAFDVNINTNQKNYQFYIKITGKEEYTLGTDKVGVWVLEGIIRRRDKNPYHKTTMKLWILDSPAKIPILIKAMSNIGVVTARLINID